MKTRELGLDNTLMKITKEDFQTMTFSYIRGLQDFVISAVKHSDNGSADFEALYLQNFHKKDSRKILQDIFINDFKLSPILVAKMFSIVEWSKTTQTLEGAKCFLRLYNKGVEPYREEDVEAFTKHEDFIQQNTFFGQMVQPIYDLRKKSEHNSSITVTDLTSWLDEIVSETSINP